jgi:hypothetical protein
VAGRLITLAVSLKRAGRVPTAVAIGLPIAWVATIPLATVGGGVISGTYYLALGYLLANHANEQAAPAVPSRPTRSPPKPTEAATARAKYRAGRLHISRALHRRPNRGSRANEGAPANAGDAFRGVKAGAGGRARRAAGTVKSFCVGGGRQVIPIPLRMTSI